MTQSASTMTSSRTDVAASLRLVEIKPGIKFGEQTLRDLLPDVETLLFFGKVFELDYTQVSYLLKLLFNSDVLRALTEGDHSQDLQDYVLDLAYQAPNVDVEDVVVAVRPPKGEILPEMWKSLEVTVAASIKEVASKLESVIGLMPGKQGHMVFKSMMTLNKQRPQILGQYQAGIAHAPQKPNLVILDDSGSVDCSTVTAIAEDVVALGYMANAHFALVSTTTRAWDPGCYSVEGVLAVAQYGGTHYETLEPLLNSRDWGVVVCIADYDSSVSAQQHLAKSVTTSIDEVIDVSLVPRPTYLAECVGQFAGKITPMLIGDRHLTGNHW